MQLLRPACQNKGFLEISGVDGMYGFFSENTGFGNNYYEDGKIGAAS